MNSFHSIEELNQIGFKSCGKNVLVSKKASIYGAENIIIGDNVRIDDFCLLSGSIEIGSYIHISAFSALYGARGITINDYSGLSPRCTVFSAVDDFSGEFMVGPMVEKGMTNVQGGRVLIEKYVQVGAGCVVMPRLTIGVGCAVGAMSFVNRSLEEWGIYAGIPAKFLKRRKKMTFSALKLT